MRSAPVTGHYTALLAGPYPVASLTVNDVRDREDHGSATAEAGEICRMPTGVAAREGGFSVATVTSGEARAETIRRGCDRFLAHHPPRTPREILADLSEYAGEREPDRYGQGELIESLEERVAALLGTESAAYFASGTMAQQAALRVWADETGMDTVVLHPLTHIEQDELRAVWELHHL